MITVLIVWVVVCLLIMPMLMINGELSRQEEQREYEIELLEALYKH